MKPSELALVSAIFLFNGIDETRLEEYTDNCVCIHYSHGDVIHSATHQFHGIGVILSGRARIVSGSGDTLLRILKQGDIFGAASVFAIGDGNRTAVIATNKCSVLMIPESVITKVISDDPGAAIRYITFLSDRINFLNSRISALAAGDAVSKVAGFILTLNADANGVCKIGDSLTNIASKLNMGRASLYRTIDRFVDKGLIAREKNCLVILDRDGLEDIIFKKDPGDFRQRKV